VKHPGTGADQRGVAEHVLGRLFAGPSGRGPDRPGRGGRRARGERAPVREALLRLERTGWSGYRTTGVPTWPPSTPVPSGRVSSSMPVERADQPAGRGGRGPGRAGVAGQAVRPIELCRRVDEFERLAQEFRRTVNTWVGPAGPGGESRAAAGPHLRALLRTFTDWWWPRRGCRSRRRWPTSGPRSPGAGRPGSGDPEAAAAATLDHVAMTAEHAVRALRRRGVFSREEA